MIEARQVTKVFHDRKRGDVRAVDDVSFSCRPGEIYGLLGANGAGKTTLLRILAALLKPTAGTAVVAGADTVAEPHKVRPNVGFLSTATALYGRLIRSSKREFAPRWYCRAILTARWRAKGPSR